MGPIKVKRGDFKMKIITSGSRYIDIDAYASCIAYRHLLALIGMKN